MSLDPSIWHDRALQAGQFFDDAIAKELADAHIVLLLVSPDFIASEYCFEREMQQAFFRAQTGKCHVVPVILKHCDWQRLPVGDGFKLGDVQALPTDGKSISKWSLQDEALLNVCSGVRNLLGKHNIITPSIQKEMFTNAAGGANAQVARNVFMNFVFDEQRLILFRAATFVVLYCGYTPRCVLEYQESSMTRIENLFKIIGGSQLAIHDISWVELNKKDELPRLNVPFELGICLSAKHFSYGRLGPTHNLILDKKQYRYQMFLSDIAGHDIATIGEHKDEANRIIMVVRNWLASHSHEVLRSAKVISK